MSTQMTYHQAVWHCKDITIMCYLLQIVSEPLFEFPNKMNFFLVSLQEIGLLPEGYHRPVYIRMTPA